MQDTPTPRNEFPISNTIMQDTPTPWDEFQISNTIMQDTPHPGIKFKSQKPISSETLRTAYYVGFSITLAAELDVYVYLQVCVIK